MSATMWVYLLSMDTPDSSPMGKVGISADPKKRLANLRRSNPYPLHLIEAFECGEHLPALIVERGVLLTLKDKRVGTSEWVRATPEELLFAFKQVAESFALEPLRPRKEPGMATDPQRGRAGFAERRSVGQLYSRANSWASELGKI